MRKKGPIGAALAPAIASSIAFSERPWISWTRQISPIVAISTLLTTKPGTSPQTIGCFLIAWAKL